MAMRRRPGMAGLKRREQTRQELQKRGQEAQEERMQHMLKQMELFKEKLQIFAQNHRQEINSNHIFRMQFQQMCRKIGVDPLASNKGFWAQILGFGDFYYELAIQIIDICISTRPLNGGLISVADVLVQLRRMRGSQGEQRIGVDDVKQAVRQIRQLGNGFRFLHPESGELMLLSVPLELNTDHLQVLQLAQKHAGMVTESLVLSSFRNWKEDRFQRVLGFLLQQGMVWLDGQTPNGEPQYFFVSLFLDDVAKMSNPGLMDAEDMDGLASRGAEAEEQKE